MLDFGEGPRPSQDIDICIDLLPERGQAPPYKYMYKYRESMLIVRLKNTIIPPTIYINRKNSVSNACICDGEAVGNVSQE